MASSGMLRRVTLVRTDVSEDLRASFIRVTRIGELGTTHAAKKYQVFLRSVRRLLFTANVVPSPPILVSLVMEVLSSSETSLLRRAQKTEFSSSICSKRHMLTEAEDWPDEWNSV
jgi:hypothetical protein